MTQQEKLNSLKVRLELTDAAQDTLLSEYLNDAAAMICAQTWRAQVVSELESAQVRLAAILYARRGAEGETQHQEGDVSRVMPPLPADILSEIRAFRLCRT